MLVYAIQHQFSKVRSFVFIDGIDEVTDYFKSTEDVGEAIHRINTEADVVWVDGHSDYGHAFEVFWQRWSKDVGPKSTVLLLGDARNNYHASQSWVVKEMAAKARHVYWLNPEPRSYWNTGDSIVNEYATHTDGSTSAATSASSRRSSRSSPDRPHPIRVFGVIGVSRGDLPDVALRCRALGWVGSVHGARVVGVASGGDQLGDLLGPVDAGAGQLLGFGQQPVEGGAPVGDHGVAAQDLGGVGDERGEEQAAGRLVLGVDRAAR